MESEFPINMTQAISVYDPPPGLMPGSRSINEVVFNVTQGYEEAHFIKQDQAVNPFWLPSRVEALLTLAEQRPFPDPNAQVDSGRIDPALSRRYLQMINRRGG